MGWVRESRDASASDNLEAGAERVCEDRILMKRNSALLIVLALALSSGACWGQQWSQDRYGLTLPIPKWLWINVAVWPP